MSKRILSETQARVLAARDPGYRAVKRHGLWAVWCVVSDHEVTFDNVPTVEVFYIASQNRQDAGWYWWRCGPDNRPDREPTGPFASYHLALVNVEQPS